MKDDEEEFNVSIKDRKHIVCSKSCKTALNNFLGFVLSQEME